MARYTEGHKSDLINKAADVAVKRLGHDKAETVARLVRQYYARVPPQDIHGETPDTLFGVAFSHWRLAARRATGAPVVRVYNPRLDEHGWRSEHTVVEIVNDNMPFLVDSITAELNRLELTVHLVIHPVLRVRRDAEGTLLDLPEPADTNGAIAESFIHAQVSHQSGERLVAIASGIERVLAVVRAAVEDWQAMRAKLSQIIETLDSGAPNWPSDELEEAKAFLAWLHDNHFTFLGYREFAVDGSSISIVASSGLGVLRDPGTFVFDEVARAGELPRAVRAFVAEKQLLAVTKTDQKSSIHRPVPMDAVGIKRFDAAGGVVGQHMFVGLFTSAAYNRRPDEIPLLRRKIKAAIERANFDPAGHSGKALLNILETFPRDELFQVTADHLFRTAIGILHLQERQRVALFVRRDDYDRFLVCLVFVPSDRYTTDLRLAIQAILERAFGGKVTSQNAEVGDSPLARLYVVIRTASGRIPDYEVSELEAEIVDAMRTWSDRLAGALIAAHGEERGLQLYRSYAEAFPPGYQDRFNAEEAVADIDLIEATLATGEIGLTLYRPLDEAQNRMRFKIYHPDEPIILSQALPMLEHLGLRIIDEVPDRVHVGRDDSRTVLIHDFGIETRSGAAVDLAAVRDAFGEVFLDVWHGRVESDRYNGLVLEAGLKSREVTIIRAYSKYLRQAGIAFSENYMQDTMMANAGVARLAVDLFRALLDPEPLTAREEKVQAIRSALAYALDQVASADEDRILRRFVDAVDCTLRTNYFQKAEDGAAKPYLSFKLDSRRLEDLPLPRPMVEVFVYSPRMEGVHLRGGKVARGGIRWSDRREDFRTEILGLMKAQMVKNVVIVPVGSKGGFIVKRPPERGDREAVLVEGIECYKTLIRGVLDLTDNLARGGLAPPTRTLRRDDDDPYLVVAADKGTATFSDIANAVSRDYGFWLGDAFASGGSHGYDHKRMGITARGAWECVKRHFRELGRNIQGEPFTCVGVGDMSGDVFGNGMLLSPFTKLVAAFNHLHIFVDPDPDPAASFAERKRLFDLPRSAWTDYDRGVMSKGGDVFDRRAKTLRLSPQIRERFGIAAERVTPVELIRTLLRADVDLLWLGGIGTYVKASHESHADAGDRSNDAVRVDGKELRCKVVGEGANLGFTQLGRIEYARKGGRINTDFIDNSAGVDCSDHEVNIKILLDAVVADGDLTVKQRNRLLVDMTDEVADLVLRDNDLQSQAITLIEADGVNALDNQARLMRMLERQGRLNRAVEFLPDEDELSERLAAREGLSRPEIAVLLSYCKIWMYDEVLASDLPDDRHLADDVVRYFPSQIQRKFRSRIPQHRLRRELIATSLTNSLINRVGGTFVTEIAEKAGVPPVDIARAYIISRDVYAVREAWDEIEALDNKVPTALQTTLHREVQRLIERGTMWFLRNGGSPIDITVNVAAYRDPVATLAASIETVLPEEMNGRILFRAERYREDGVPEAPARRIAYLIAMPSACDIVRIAAARGVAVEEIARLYFSLGELLGFGWLRYQAEKVSAASHWQKLAVSAIVEELYAHQHRLTQRVLDTTGKATDGAIEAWTETCGPSVDRVRALLGELEAAKPVDLSMLTVASRQLGTLTAS